MDDRLRSLRHGLNSLPGKALGFGKRGAGVLEHRSLDHLWGAKMCDCASALNASQI